MSALVIPPAEERRLIIEALDYYIRSVSWSSNDPDHEKYEQLLGEHQRAADAADAEGEDLAVLR